VIELINSFMNI